MNNYLNYTEAISYIHSLLKFGIKPGLERVALLLEKLGNPQEKLQFVHVAGTNGKGSVSAMIAASLQSAGYRTGLFTSPYITDFCERIQMDGRTIPHNELAEITSLIKAIITDMPESFEITEFEVITAIAMEWFRRRGCEIAVLETGLGGRLDSTNVIPSPLVCVLTHIDMDHTDILGNTITAIAEEKCGIMKPNVPTVVYPKQDEAVWGVINEHSKKKNCRLVPTEASRVRPITITLDGNTFEYEGRQWKTLLSGEHQILNAVTAIASLKELKVAEHHIEEGLRSTFLPARQEVISFNPTIILDGGHNADGAKALAEMISRQTDKAGRIYGIIGCLRDKEYEKIFFSLCPLFTDIYTVPVPSPRTLSAEECKKEAAKYCKNVHTAKDVKSAFRTLYEGVDERDFIIICGSLYLAGEIRPTLLELTY